MMDREQCPYDERLLGAPADAVDEGLQLHVDGCERCQEQARRLTQLARVGAALPEGALTSAREAAIRDTLLARAAAAPPTRPRWPRGVAAALVAAAAIALAVLVPRWTAPDDGGATITARRPQAHRGTVRPRGDARYTVLGAAPDEIVHLMDGTIDVEVEHLGPGERFRVVTADGEVEVRGTAFEVDATGDRLSAVRVLRGRVTVRSSSLDDPIALDPGEAWRAPPLPPRLGSSHAPPAADEASSDDREAPRPVARLRAPAEERRLAARRTLVEVSALPRPVATAPPSRDRGPGGTATTPQVHGAQTQAPAAPAGEPRRSSPSPTELRYQEAWGAMRVNDFGRAIAAFEGVLGDPGSPLAEDAAYWRAVALGRAGRDTEAIGALRHFLGAWPGAARTDEVQTMLGWLLHARGDDLGAGRAFRAALSSPTLRVRESASRGLEAVGGRHAAETPPP